MLSFLEQRRPGPRQQPALHPAPRQTLDQAQHLQLPAAHLAAAIEVQDLHPLMFRAFAYFTKV